MIKKLAALLSICTILLLQSCTKDDYEAIGDEIYDEDEYSPTLSPNERELLVVLEPYFIVDGVKKYIISDSIFNIAITINNNKWGTYAANYYPPNKQTVEISNGFSTTNDTAKYAVVAPQTYTSYEDPQTAGEFATVLTENLDLEPGTYNVILESFYILDKQGNAYFIPVNYMRFVTIELSTKSAFVGTMEIDLTNILLATQKGMLTQGLP